MNKVILVLVLINCSTVFSQTQNTYKATIAPQGYGLSNLNSTGTSAIVNDVSNISSMNPASISQFKNYSSGISYQFNTDIEEGWYSNISTNRSNNLIPQSFGAIVSFDEFIFAAAFSQNYNLILDLGPIPVTTTAQPYGTGEFISATSEVTIMDFSIISALEIGNLVGLGNLDFGLKISFSRFHQYDKVGRTTGKVSDYQVGFSTGFVYKYDLEPDRKLEAGISYKSKNKFTGVFEIEGNNLISLEPDTTNGHIPAESTPSKMVAYLPYEINSDLSIDVTSKFKLLTSLGLILWKSQPSLWDNQLIYSASAVLKFNEVTSASIGFSSSDLTIREENYFYNRANFFNVFFITAGLKLALNNFNIDIALADSHLMSGKFREQTIGKIALGLTL